MDPGGILICAYGIDDQAGAGTRACLTCDDCGPSPIYTPEKKKKIGRNSRVMGCDLTVVTMSLD